MADWSRVARRIRVPLGFGFAFLYLWLARPTWKSFAIGSVVVVAGLLIRAAASGHVRKNEVLTTSGPYAYTRNPLYLGSLLIGIGFALAAQSWWVGAMLVIMLLAIYVPVIRSEERFLREKFPGFDEYAQRVPPILPRLAAARISEQAGGFSLELYLKHREWNALLGSALLAAALVLKMTVLR